MHLDDDALILFTSGTTGQPKGVVHTHRSLRARWTSLRDHLGLGPYRRTLCLLPTHFGHGLICNCLFPWLSGCELFIQPPFRPELLAQLGAVVDEHEITFMSSVPAVWRIAERLAKPPQAGSLERVFVGSAPLTAQLCDPFRQVTRWNLAALARPRPGHPRASARSAPTRARPAVEVVGGDLEPVRPSKSFDRVAHWHEPSLLHEAVRILRVHRACLAAPLVHLEDPDRDHVSDAWLAADELHGPPVVDLPHEGERRRKLDIEARLLAHLAHERLRHELALVDDAAGKSPRTAPRPRSLPNEDDLVASTHDRDGYVEDLAQRHASAAGTWRIARQAARTPARERARSSAAATNSRKSGAGRVGRDLNSG